MRQNKLPKLASKKFARSMRKNPTPAEEKLWYKLRDRRFADFKFRRQKIIGKYIVDFVCIAQKLIIEADGSHHDVDADKARDDYLRSLGFRMMRFSNFDIKRNLDFVLENIWVALHDRKFDPNGNSPSPGLSGHPLPAGRGENK